MSVNAGPRKMRWFAIRTVTEVLEDGEVQEEDGVERVMRSNDEMIEVLALRLVLAVGDEPNLLSDGPTDPKLKGPIRSIQAENLLEFQNNFPLPPVIAGLTILRKLALSAVKATLRSVDPLSGQLRTSTKGS